MIHKIKVMIYGEAVAKAYTQCDELVHPDFSNHHWDEVTCKQCLTRRPDEST